MKQFLLVAIAGLALLSSCSQQPTCGNSKADFLQGYYDLINEATAGKLPMSDEGWKKYDERFRAYVEECYEQYESELSPKERRRFWARSVKYYARRYGTGMVKALEEKGDKTATKVKEEVEKIWTDADEALKEATGKVKPEQLLKPGQAETE